MADKQFTQTRTEFTPIFPHMDFIDLAEYSERLVSVLIESDNNAERLAISQEMTSCLMHLQLALTEPVPPSRIPQLTAEDEMFCRNTPFIAEPEIVNEYCLALNQALLRRVLSPEIEEALTGLLFDLINYQVDDLKAPRFIQTIGGLQHLR